MSILVHAAACAAAAVIAPAAEPDPDVYVQEKITITASRIEQTVAEALASVTVISRADIELSQAADLAELLRAQAGIDISRSGGPGSQTSLFLRGSNSNHTLVLVDGVRVSSVHTGAFAWENLPLAQVDHIEVVRGPRGGYYGSDAIGGVIHIHTRRPDGARLSLTGGSFGTGRIDAGAVMELPRGQAALSVHHQEVGGFSAQNPAGFAYHPDDDGFRESGALLTLDQELGRHRLDAGLRAHRAEVEFDQGVSDTDTGQLALRLHGPLAEHWEHALNLGWVDEQRTTPEFFTRFDSERVDLDWQISYRGRARHRLTAGLAYVDEQGVSLETFGNSVSYSGSRRNAAAFGGWQFGLGRQDLELALRYDDNSEFGSEWTGHLAWAHPLGRHGGLTASYGRAFRAPTLSEQLSPGFGGLFAGNPELAPERSDSIEVGLRYAFPNQRLGLSVYRTRIDDLIAFSGVDFQAVNLARAAIDGFEAEYQWRSRHWRLEANLTLQDTEDRLTGEPLLRRADEKLALAADRLFAGGARLGADVLYTGERADFAGSLDGFWLVGVRASHPIGTRWRIGARLSNLLDEEYEPALGFNGAGRAAYLTLRYAGD